MTDNEKPEKTDADIDNGKRQNETPALVLARDIYPEDIPIIPVMNHPMFPHITAPMSIESPAQIALLAERFKNNQRYAGMLLRRELQPGEEDEKYPSSAHMHDWRFDRDNADSATIRKRDAYAGYRARTFQGSQFFTGKTGDDCQSNISA